MANATAPVVPGFFPPWQGVARAYPVALTFEAALAGFKRKRKPVLFHMPNTGEAGRKHCAVCKGRLSAPAKAFSVKYANNVRSEGSASQARDRYSTWTYDPKLKAVKGGMHYVCSWGDLLGQVHSQARYAS